MPTPITVDWTRRVFCSALLVLRLRRVAEDGGPQTVPLFSHGDPSSLGPCCGRGIFCEPVFMFVNVVVFLNAHMCHKLLNVF